MNEQNRQENVPWGEVERAVPEFARGVRERFGAYRHHVLGTLRVDGAPRLTGLEADFRDDELYLGMMPSSRKALDLRRDPRFGLHANPGATGDMDGGDVRVSGRAVEITDPAQLARYAAAMPEGAIPEKFHLFRADVREVVRTTIEGEEIVFRIWTPGRGLRTVRRGNDDSPPRTDPVG
ncbi:pyridoxamine 5'-phosphate oxidase family protein [Streptomyces sulphureus]|uniref:pyridoxamine 5'-phosphate oxidase family protein n=1 Tax=Streptomyces sulphureus TaxID=47758 RepID=UPI00035EF26B|nr:pyridoxamine 5'-phosphate oxidase family protein [Streptomyces sulphureus]